MGKINLKHLKKCDQVWEEMSPTAQGRICAKCQHTIIDFRGLTDKKMTEVHMFSEGKVCGLYRKDQLTIKPGKRQYSGWRSSIVALMGILTSTNVSGQETRDTTKIEIREPNYEDRASVTRPQTTTPKVENDSLAIGGMLKDENGEPLIGATILVKGTSTGTVSNIQGYYSLEVGHLLADTSQLVMIYSYTGFKTQEFTLSQEMIVDRQQIKVDMSFEQATGGLTDFYVVGKGGIHRRIWWSVKNFFRKKR